MKLNVMLAALITSGSLSALAIPTLQLDIGGGTYAGGTDGATVANADSFDLYALLNPGKKKGAISGTYRISAAIYPRLTETDLPEDLGTFSFGGSTYAATADMVWGAPPAELLPGTTGKGKGLPAHSVYSTYFKEFVVTFDPAVVAEKYNVQGDDGDPTTHPGSGLYYQTFAVDVGDLADGYGLHFDLYQLGKKSGGKSGKANGKKGNLTDVIAFAPGSHDAESRATRDSSRTPDLQFPRDEPQGTTPPVNRIPDPVSTMSLMGLSLASLALISRRLGRG